MLYCMLDWALMLQENVPVMYINVIHLRATMMPELPSLGIKRLEYCELDSLFCYFLNSKYLEYPESIGLLKVNS